MTLENICKQFDTKQVLKGVSHEFAAGECTCILGESGGGKTTLLRIMMGLTKPDSGRVIGIQGKLMSAVFQEDRLCMGLTAGANLRLVNPAMSKQEAALMLGCAGLEDEQIPVRSLSGGMRRRVAILRALAVQYDILFMDEPLRGLDEVNHTRMMEYLKNQTAGKTVICVTHNENEAEFLATVPLLRLQVNHKGHGF